MATASNGADISYNPSGNQMLLVYHSGSGADTRFGWDGDLRLATSSIKLCSTSIANEALVALRIAER
jgi:hypothetical protein